jgi:hypothetical protein
VRTVFQETLLGPKNHDSLSEDFSQFVDKKAYPDFHKELSIFSRNPKNPSERITIDMLLEFLVFDSEHQVLIENEEHNV